jgi:hypothetical protein
MSQDDPITQQILAMIAPENKTTPIAQWKFVPGGLLKINDKELDIYPGEVYYANSLYQIMNAIKIKDWVFVLERAIYDRPDMIHISGFHGNTHCTFLGVTLNEAPSEDIFFNIIMDFFFNKILPIVYPDEIHSNLTFKMIRFNGDELKASQNPETYNGRGVLNGGLNKEQIKLYIESQKKEQYSSA